MARAIDQETCIQCGVCLNECPNGGISEVDGVHVIHPGLCTDCFGVADQPTCASVCPVDAVIADPNDPADETVLADRAADFAPERIMRG